MERCSLDRWIILFDVRVLLNRISFGFLKSKGDNSGAESFNLLEESFAAADGTSVGDQNRQYGHCAEFAKTGGR
jgi:hypothetical protein